MTSFAPGAPQRVLLGPGNDSVTQEQIREFINKPGTTGRQILDAAIENKVSVKQLADAMQGTPGFDMRDIKHFLASEGIHMPKGSGRGDSNMDADKLAQAQEQAARAAERAAAARAQSKAERRQTAIEQKTMFGRGNDSVSSEQIRNFISQPGRTNAEILDAALDHHVSVTQMMVAMSGQPGWSLGEVQGFLASQGLTAPDSYWSDVAKLLHVVNGHEGKRQHHEEAKILFGQGSPDISGQQIRGFVKQVMASGGSPEVMQRQVLDAALGHNVSAAQLMEAMRGERGWSAEGVRDYLSSQGLDAPAGYWSNGSSSVFEGKGPHHRAKEVLFGMGNGKISSDDIREFLNKPGLLRRDALDAALENGVSVSQVVLAMRGQPGWSPTEIRAYLDAVGPKQPDAYWNQVDDLLTVMYGNGKRDHRQALKAVFGQGNQDISTQEIRDFVRQTLGAGGSGMNRQLLEVAVANNVSVEQVVNAMRGEDGWTAAQLREYLASQGLETSEQYWTQLDSNLSRHIFAGKRTFKDALKTVFGAGNPDLADAQIRGFYDTPRRLARDNLEAALDHGVSVEQYVMAMREHPEWQKHEMSFNLNNVRDYLTRVGLNAPEGYWARMETALGISQAAV